MDPRFIEQLNERIIRNFFGKLKPYNLIEINSNIYIFEIEKHIVNINHNSSNVTFTINGNETYFTFDSLGKYHGLKCVTNFTTREIFMERYNHGIPHGEWTYDKPYNYWVKNYNNGVLDGFFKIRDRFNKIKGNYKKGVYDGTTEYFDMSSGTAIPSKTEFYKDGTLINVINHNEEKFKQVTAIEVPLKVIGSDKCLFWKR
jgi:hypothetical protein